ncbi:MAG: exodeoxyribonuclease-3, partial [Glaciecola sp.]
HAPDVICLQETTGAEGKFPMLEVQSLGYDAADNNGGGREGVAILAKSSLGMKDITFELDGNPRPEEARWVEATVNGIRFCCVYVVNGRSLEHPVFSDKLEMLDRMADRAQELVAAGPTVITGDFNVAPRDEDVYDPKAFEGATHTSAGERIRLQAMLDLGLKDAWDATPLRGEHQYTWWDYRMGAFHKNKGLRIDLALLTEDLAAGLSQVSIDRELRKNVNERGGIALAAPAKPSDHAPLLVRFDV